MSTRNDSSLHVNFLFNNREEVFQDCIDFLDSEAEPNYLQQTEYSLKLHGPLHGGFDYEQNPLSASLDGFRNVTFNTAYYSYTSPDDGIEKLDTLFGFVSRLYQAVSPTYVYGIHNWRIEGWQEGGPKHKIPSPVSNESLANNRIEHPTWLMLFPPEMVEEYGREWLLDLPAEYIEELDDGAILIVATQALPDCDSNVEIVERIEEAMAPIEDAFAGKH